MEIGFSNYPLQSGINIIDKEGYESDRFTAEIKQTHAVFPTTNDGTEAKSYYEIFFLKPEQGNSGVNKVIPIEITVQSSYIESGAYLYAKLKLIYKEKETIFKWGISQKSLDDENSVQVLLPTSFIYDFIFENYEPGSKDLAYKLFMSVSPMEDDEDSMYFDFVRQNRNYPYDWHSVGFSGRTIEAIGFETNGMVYNFPISSSSDGTGAPFSMDVIPTQVDVTNRPYFDTGGIKYCYSSYISGFSITRQCNDAQLAILRDFFDIYIQIDPSAPGEDMPQKKLPDDVDLKFHEPYTIFSREDIAIMTSASGGENLTRVFDNYYMDDTCWFSTSTYLNLYFKSDVTLEDMFWYNLISRNPGATGSGEVSPERRLLSFMFKDVIATTETALSIQNKSVQISPFTNGYLSTDLIYSGGDNYKKFTDGILSLDLFGFNLKHTGEFFASNAIRSNDLTPILSNQLDNAGAAKRYFNYKGGINSQYASELPHEYFCNRPFVLEVSTTSGCRIGPYGEYQYTAFQTITFHHNVKKLNANNVEIDVQAMTEFDRVVCEYDHKGKQVSPWRHKMTITIDPAFGSGDFYSYDYDTGEFTLKISAEEAEQES